MPVVGPIIPSHLYESDSKSAADRLVYHVTLSTGVTNPLKEPGLPQYGDKHPILEGALVDRFGIQEWIIPGSKCAVVVYYSSDGRFRFPQFPQPDPSFRPWEIETTGTVLELPTLWQRPVLKGCVSGSQGQWTHQWFKELYKVEIGLSNVQRTVTVTSFSSADRLYIENQYNRFHLLDPNGQGSRLYRFKGGTERQTGTAQWTITYRWIRDNGNGGIQLSSLGSGIDPTSVVLPPARQSFYAYQVYFPLTGFDPCSQSSAAVPSIFTIPTYDVRPASQGGDVDALAARNLPGNPLV